MASQGAEKRPTSAQNGPNRAKHPSTHAGFRPNIAQNRRHWRLSCCKSYLTKILEGNEKHAKLSKKCLFFFGTICASNWVCHTNILEYFIGILQTMQRYTNVWSVSAFLAASCLDVETFSTYVNHVGPCSVSLKPLMGVQWAYVGCILRKNGEIVGHLAATSRDLGQFRENLKNAKTLLFHVISVCIGLNVGPESCQNQHQVYI